LYNSAELRLFIQFLGSPMNQGFPLINKSHILCLGGLTQSPKKHPSKLFKKQGQIPFAGVKNGTFCASRSYRRNLLVRFSLQMSISRSLNSPRKYSINSSSAISSTPLRLECYYTNSKHILQIGTTSRYFIYAIMHRHFLKHFKNVSRRVLFFDNLSINLPVRNN
jgi:hypothetical protein